MELIESEAIDLRASTARALRKFRSCTIRSWSAFRHLLHPLAPLSKRKATHPEKVEGLAIIPCTEPDRTSQRHLQKLLGCSRTVS
jgi:hypothetical protein